MHEGLIKTILEYKEVAAKMLDICIPLLSSFVELSEEDLRTFEQLTGTILEGFSKTSLGEYTLLNLQMFCLGKHFRYQTHD